MKKKLYSHIRLIITVIMLLFVLINFLLLTFCVETLNQKYQEDIADSACTFAVLTINADSAKDYLILRKTDDAYTDTLQKLKDYQQQTKAIRRISLVSFGSTTGNYIYDTEGMTLGSQLDYTSYTESVQTELINGRSQWTEHNRNNITFYHPLRTVDDRLAGYLIIEMDNNFQSQYFPVLAGISAGILFTGIFLMILLTRKMKKTVFQPIQQYVDAVHSFTAGEDVPSSDLLAIPDDNEIGQLGQAIGKVFSDLSNGAKDLSKAVYEANHDGMTQVLNKRCYEQMEETFRHCGSICLIYFDVNNLKLMNDTLGHEKGDYVIKKAAEYIRSFLSPSDYCFRMGGDEFLMVMTDCSFRSIDMLSEKLNADSPYILSQGSDSVRCAISYGYAYAKGNYSYEALLAKAEENMYAKKTELKKLMQMPER